jgi:hypothetical protein
MAEGTLGQFIPLRGRIEVAKVLPKAESETESSTHVDDFFLFWGLGRRIHSVLDLRRPGLSLIWIGRWQSLHSMLRYDLPNLLECGTMSIFRAKFIGCQEHECFDVFELENIFENLLDEKDVACELSEA